MAKKEGNRKRLRDKAPKMVEDLDLEVSDIESIDQFNDEDIVHNRERKKTSRNDNDEETIPAVMPSDAHRLDGLSDEEHGGYLEEEEMARATERSMRKKATDEDFTISGLSLASTAKAAKRNKESSAKNDVLDAVPAVEAVERDFALLTTSERLRILKKESPELLNMLEDLKKYLSEVKALAKPLHELLYERKVSEADKNFVTFLETKVQLMLSYCMHVTFYLLLKSEGKKVAGHPVVDNLVEIRVYLEKMWPLEEKLQYSLNRLLSGKTASAAHVDELRPLQGSDSGVYEATRSTRDTEAREHRRHMRNMKEADDLEKEELAAMTRVRTKKASFLNNVQPSSKVAPLSYQEDEDQYFTKLQGSLHDEDDEDAGLSLMDALRKRQQAAKALEAAASAPKDPEPEHASDDEEDMLELDGESDVAPAEDDVSVDEEDYEALFEEEKARERDRAASAATPREPLHADEVDRRKAGKRIESHRGLTKARPKDRKTPRVAQRRKYERGLRVHKAQAPTYQPEPEKGFVGVRAIKPGVLRGRKLQ
ncbi:unnamed protein product [Phytomonas sp. EM1]|nr:unnamed protein product [Phytomonas sp. EM1]|eukprot:CCW62398.1 unnamed protein product [Phytomonas sp. isolate EM1]